VGTGKEVGNYIQCRECGHIYKVYKEISIEKSIVYTECPRCGCGIGLNCGNNTLDLYVYYDPTMDKRYYEY